MGYVIPGRGFTCGTMDCHADRVCGVLVVICTGDIGSRIRYQEVKEGD